MFWAMSPCNVAVCCEAFLIISSTEEKTDLSYWKYLNKMFCNVKIVTNYFGLYCLLKKKKIQGKPE